MPGPPLLSIDYSLFIQTFLLFRAQFFTFFALLLFNATYRNLLRLPSFTRPVSFVFFPRSPYYSRCLMIPAASSSTFPATTATNKKSASLFSPRVLLFDSTNEPNASPNTKVKHKPLNELKMFIFSNYNRSQFALSKYPTPTPPPLLSSISQVFYKYLFCFNSTYLLISLILVHYINISNCNIQGVS